MKVGRRAFLGVAALPFVRPAPALIAEPIAQVVGSAWGLTLSGLTCWYRAGDLVGTTLPDGTAVLNWRKPGVGATTPPGETPTR